MRTWELAAECLSYPPELFAVTQRGNPAPGVQASLCEPCPVALPCLIDGWWDEYAIRGGWTPRQRRALEGYLAERRAAAECLEESAVGG